MKDQQQGVWYATIEEDELFTACDKPFPAVPTLISLIDNLHGDNHQLAGTGTQIWDPCRARFDRD